VVVRRQLDRSCYKLRASYTATDDRCSVAVPYLWVDVMIDGLLRPEGLTSALDQDRYYHAKPFSIACDKLLALSVAQYRASRGDRALMRCRVSYFARTTK
jgi:hypothetical protein